MSPRKKSLNSTGYKPASSSRNCEEVNGDYVEVTARLRWSKPTTADSCGRVQEQVRTKLILSM